MLAAVAVPAYNKYKVQAVASTMTDTVNKVKQAFSACLVTSTFAACSNADVNDTVKAHSSAPITGQFAAQKSCWLVTKGDHTACVQYDNDNSGFPAAEAKGQPIGTPCSAITPTCVVAVTACSGGCTYTANGAICATSTFTGGPPNCGTGSTTTAVTVACATAGTCG